MPTALRLIHERMNRARDRLRDFRRVEAEFLSRDPYELSVKFDGHRKAYALWFHVREQPPVELSLILSECVHHMRATLDNAACAMADRHAGSDRYTAFPVCREAHLWGTKTTQRRLARLPPAAYPVLEHLQPYHDARGAKRHSLALLDRLWNADKHRGLVLTLGSASQIVLRFNKPVYLYSFWMGGFDRDRAVVYAKPRGWVRESDTELRYKLRPKFRVGFSRGGPYQHGIVVATNLQRLYDFVRREAVPALRPFL